MKAIRSKFGFWIGILIFVFSCTSLWFFLAKTTIVDDKNDDFYKKIIIDIKDGNFPTVLHLNMLGKLFLVGYENGNIEIVNTSTPDIKKIIKAHSLRVSNISTSYDGKIIASNSNFDDDTRIWNASTGNIISTIKNARDPIMFYMKSRTIIIPSGDKIRIYNIDKDEIDIIKYQSGDTVTSVMISNSGKYLAVGNSVGEIYLWKIIDNTNKFNILDYINNNCKILIELIEFNKISIDSDWITSILFTNNDTELYTTCSSGKVFSWKLGFFGKEKMIETKLKGLRQSYIINNTDILVSGVNYLNDIGYGSVEYITKMNEDTKIINIKLSKFTPVLYIENKNILIAPYKEKLIPININNSTK